MKHSKLFLLSLLMAGACTASVHAQGVIGMPYFGLEAGYERLRGLPDSRSLDGVGAGAEFNMPLTRGRQEVGLDARIGLDFFRVDGSVGAVQGDGNGGMVLLEGGSNHGSTKQSNHMILLEGGLRAHTSIHQVLKPYAGAGLGWGRERINPPNESSQTNDALYFPLELGIEWAQFPFSLTPYFRYIISTDSDFDDFWQVGVRGAYWFNRGMATTLSVAHTDFDNDTTRLGVRLGMLFSF